MRKKNLLVLFSVVFIASPALAVFCSSSDSGGKLIDYSVKCFGKGELVVYCSDDSNRGQCFQRKECQTFGCEVTTDGKYELGCKANCGDSNSTAVTIVCEPKPLSLPSINLPQLSYSGEVGQNFFIEGFGSDSQLVRDIYFEPVPGCDINNSKQGIGTTTASVKADFYCSQEIADFNLTLVVEDSCRAESRDSALFSITKHCPHECTPSLYPQCKKTGIVECVEEGECTRLKTTNCPFGCVDFECCVPQDCSGLEAGCGRVSDGCGNELDCGSCAEGLECSGNKCAISDTGQPASGLPFAIPFIDPLIIFSVAVVAVIGAIIYIFREQ